MRRQRQGFNIVTDTLRIAHCSDIHLDPEARAGSRNDRQRAAFARALAQMAAHRPDILLLAGDLFESNHASAETIIWAMEMLGAAPCPVVMIPGNHDCMEEGAIYRRHDFGRIPNVSLLAHAEGEVTRLPDLSVAVWGKGMVEHAPEYQPLHGRPDRPAGVRWYLGLGHGLFVPHGGAAHYRSSPIHMADIEASPFDYLALGHHHAAMELVSEGVTAAYSGSPTDSVGRGPTYVVVDLAAGRAPVLDVHVVKAAAGPGADKEVAAHGI